MIRRIVTAEHLESRAPQMRHHAGRPPDVEHRPAARLCHERTDEFGALGRVLALLVLDGLGVDQASVERTHKRTIRAVVEAAVGLGRHSGVEKYEAAAAARVRLSRVAIAIAMRQDNELRSAAQVARRHRLLRLRCVVEVESGDPRTTIWRHGDGQYVNLFSIFSSTFSRQSAIRPPALPSPYRRSLFRLRRFTSVWTS